MAKRLPGRDWKRNRSTEASRIRSYTPDELRERVTKFRALLAQLTSAADAMDEDDLESIAIDGTLSLDRSNREMLRFIENVEKGIAVARVRGR